LSRLLLTFIAALFTTAGAAALGFGANAGSNSSTGIGTVFLPNPVAALQDQTLSDRKDADYPALAPAYHDVTLTNLDGSGHLRGDWANIVSATGPPAYSPTNTFTYHRNDDRFEQVMAYYWITTAQRYIQSLGFGTSLRPVNRESQDVRVNQLGLDNSFERDTKDVIRYGKGGVDDAEDAEIILHEYGHAIQASQQSPQGFGVAPEARAIAEGFADYWAVTVTATFAPTPDQPCIGDWDAASYTAENPHCLAPDRPEPPLSRRPRPPANPPERPDLVARALGDPQRARRADRGHGDPRGAVQHAGPDDAGARAQHGRSGSASVRNVSGEQGHRGVPRARDPLAAGSKLGQLGVDDREQAVGPELDEDDADLLGKRPRLLAAPALRLDVGEREQLRSLARHPPGAPAQLQRLSVLALGGVEIARVVVAPGVHEGLEPPIAGGGRDTFHRVDRIGELGGPVTGQQILVGEDRDALDERLRIVSSVKRRPAPHSSGRPAVNDSPARRSSSRTPTDRKQMRAQAEERGFSLHGSRSPQRRLAQLRIGPQLRRKPGGTLDAEEPFELEPGVSQLSLQLGGMVEVGGREVGIAAARAAVLTVHQVALGHGTELRIADVATEETVEQGRETRDRCSDREPAGSQSAVRLAEGLHPVGALGEVVQGP
jgi:hypothetical protein